MKPWLSDPDVDIHVGDALEVLRGLPDGSVDCCVTSPPYWGLRDYGTGAWKSGDPDCDHQKPFSEATLQSSGLNLAKDRANTQSNVGSKHGNGAYRYLCAKCGAHRVDRQLGLEATPDLYVAAMVAVFAEVRRVLADHGTLWLNIGDSYANTGNWNQERINSGVDGRPNLPTPTKAMPPGLKPKDLCGIPWRLAFALQADGWWLRSDIIWAKPNPMPESVTDRPTKAHEYVFLLSKRPRYFYDAEAVREPHKVAHIQRQDSAPKDRGDQRQFRKQGLHDFVNPNGRNVRSVWEIATQPYPEAHFATFPEELPRRAILAGCPEWVCAVCGKARERIVERESYITRPTTGRDTQKQKVNPATSMGLGRVGGHVAVDTQTLGWSDCGHDAYRPGTVLDPFLGSGTTAHVARKHGRRCVGIELNETYAQLAARRLQQLSLLAEGGYA